MSVRLSPVLTGLDSYPFLALQEAKRRRAEAGEEVTVLDF